MGDEGEGKEYTVEYADGEAETCNWVKRPGRAKVTYPSGDTFVGTFDESKKYTGKGVYTWKVTEDGANSGVYAGAYANGKKHGIGKITYPNGDKYHGFFSRGFRHGEGTYIYKNGDIYSGQWIRNLKEGRGTYVYAANESQLVGEWVGGKIVSGKWVFSNGTTYTGKFNGVQPSGKGVFIFKSGNMQAGEYFEKARDDGGDALELVWKGETLTKAHVDVAALNRNPAMFTRVEGLAEEVVEGKEAPAE